MNYYILLSVVDQRLSLLPLSELVLDKSMLIGLMLSVLPQPHYVCSYSQTFPFAPAFIAPLMMIILSYLVIWLQLRTSFNYERQTSSNAERQAV